MTARDEVIFTTVHGSRLYGFAHAGSDYDTFTVTANARTALRQTLDGAGNDRVVVGIERFLGLVHSGSHQSVEALFSPMKEWANTLGAVMYRPMLEHTLVRGGDAYAKYERTIRKFCYGDLKRRRHAVRLSYNLAGLRAHGRFNPRLDADVAAHSHELAERLDGDELARFLLA